MGADSISKLMQQKMGKDRWNVRKNLLTQNQELVKSNTNVNIPYLFRYQRKNNKGWINLNPFQSGTMVIGTPGSGKSLESLILPSDDDCERFCLCIYDFKFPSLLLNCLLPLFTGKSKDSKIIITFQCINLNEVEKSKESILFIKIHQTLAEGTEMANNGVIIAKGGSSSGGGSEVFFTSISH